jgi:choline-sulfatase
MSVRLSVTLAAILLSAMTAASMTPSYGYDFRANLPLAHVIQGGPVADASQVGFAKYTRDLFGRWKTGVQHAGAPAAYTPGLQANLWLPLGGDLQKSGIKVEFRIDPLGQGQRMDIFAQGKKIGHKVLKPGWQTHSFLIPAELTKKGDLHLRMHFRKTVDHKGRRTAAAIRYVQLKPKDAAELPGEEKALAAMLVRAAGNDLTLPAHGGLDWFVVPARGSRLHGRATGAPVKVFIETSGRRLKKIGQGLKLDIDLSKYADRPSRILIRSIASTRISSLEITGGTAGQPEAQSAPKHVIFWLIDTLRADKLRAYQQDNANKRPKPRTPHIDALLKEATVFQNFWVQGNESKASHASLFTGAYPALHTVHGHSAKLPKSLTTLAETFTAAGYLSGGYVSNGYISSKWQFAQGFKKSVFSNFIRENKANSARAIFASAKKFIDKYKAKPFYLYLGTSDPHVTYRAHKGLLKRYDSAPYSGTYKKNVTGTELGVLKRRKALPRTRDRQRIEALYENEIEFNDIYFGKLIAHLKAAGIYDQTMIIVSSDHGDEFWEHGSCGHGQSLHQELISVPLIIKMPGWLPKGKRMKFGVDGVDLLPTVQRILGQTRSKGIQGEELLGKVWSKGPIYPIAQIASMGVKRYALQVGPAKIIMAGPKAIKVYDTGNDPAEQTDVSSKKPIYARAALDALLLFAPRAKRWDKHRWGPPNNLTRLFETDTAKSE